MLMRLDLVLTTEAGGRMATGEVGEEMVGSVGEEVKDTKSPDIICMLTRDNNKPKCSTYPGIAR